MKIYYLFVLICILCALLACSNGKKNETNIANIYEQKCALCHGKNGDLQLNGASNLQKSTLDKGQLISVIQNGRGKMLAYKNQLTQEQIESMAVYLGTLRK